MYYTVSEVSKTCFYLEESTTASHYLEIWGGVDFHTGPEVPLGISTRHMCSSVIEPQLNTQKAWVLLGGHLPCSFLELSSCALPPRVGAFSGIAWASDWQLLGASTCS